MDDKISEFERFIADHQRERSKLRGIIDKQQLELVSGHQWRAERLEVTGRIDSLETENDILRNKIFLLSKLEDCEDNRLVIDLKQESKLLKNENLFLSDQSEKVKTEFSKLHQRIEYLEKKNEEYRTKNNEYLKELIYLKERCQVEVFQTVDKNNNKLMDKYDVPPPFFTYFRKNSIVLDEI